MAKRRVLTLLSIPAAALALAACQTPTPPPPAPPPPPRAVAPPPPPPTPLDEFAWSQRPGPNSLIGLIQYRPGANQTWTCAGQSVALTPETSYSRSRMATLYGSPERALQSVGAVRSRSAANPGLDYSRFVQTTTCDAQDGFSFRQLPDGAYFIIARVRQTRPAGAGGDMVIMQRVELRGGAAVRMVLPQGAR
jgi:hypothetical protein